VGGPGRLCRRPWVLVRLFRATGTAPYATTAPADAAGRADSAGRARSRTDRPPLGIRSRLGTGPSVTTAPLRRWWPSADRSGAGLVRALPPPSWWSWPRWPCSLLVHRRRLAGHPVGPRPWPSGHRGGRGHLPALGGRRPVRRAGRRGRLRGAHGPASGGVVGIAPAFRRRTHRCTRRWPGVRSWPRWCRWCWPIGAVPVGGPLLDRSPWSSGWWLGGRAGVDRQPGHRPAGPAGPGRHGRRRRHRTGRRRLRRGSAGRRLRMAATGHGDGRRCGRARARRPPWSRPRRAGGTSRQRLQPVGVVDGRQSVRRGLPGAVAGRPRSLNQGSWARETVWPMPPRRTEGPTPMAVERGEPRTGRPDWARLVDQAMSERTDQLGRMLAPAGVRYVVLLTSLAPEISGEQNPEEYPVPAGLPSALGRPARPRAGGLGFGYHRVRQHRLDTRAGPPSASGVG
jgi:hypothetical protein